MGRGFIFECACSEVNIHLCLLYFCSVFLVRSVDDEFDDAGTRFRDFKSDRCIVLWYQDYKDLRPGLKFELFPSHGPVFCDEDAYLLEERGFYLSTVVYLRIQAEKESNCLLIWGSRGRITCNTIIKGTPALNHHSREDTKANRVLQIILPQHLPTW